MKRLLYILVLYVVASPVFAADPPSWIGPTKIVALTVQPNGRIYLSVDTNTPDLGCTGNAEGRLEFDTDAPHFKEQFSLLMAAYMANKDVTIYVNHCGWFPYAQNSKIH